MQNMPPEDSDTTGCLKVVLVVVVIGILLVVLGIAAIFIGVSSAEGSDQRVRISTAERLQSRCEQVTILDRDGKHKLTFTGKDARLLGSIAQKAMALEASTTNSFTHHTAALHVAYSSSEEQDVRVAHTNMYAYFLDGSGEWYWGSIHHSFFVTLVWVTCQHENGVAPAALSTDTAEVEQAYDELMRLRRQGYLESWQGLTAEETEFVKSWVKRYDAISGHTPLDNTKLLPAE